MLTTLVLAAAMAASSSVAPVNFVHAYKQGDKLTYAMNFVSEDMGFEMSMTLYLLFGATKDGKTDVTIKITEEDSSTGEMQEMDDIELVFDRNGVPIVGELSANGLMIVIVLMTTYLPNKQLDVGESFEFVRENEEFEMTSQGKFAGMELVKGADYAVLESDAIVSTEDDGDVTLKIKTYYNPRNKRVERTTAEISTPDGELSLSLTMKK